MRINVHKSVCMRFWQRFNIQCANLITDSGDELKWVEECRYLGVYLLSARQFKCIWHNAKFAFYRAFNAIFGRLGRSAIRNQINCRKIKCLNRHVTNDNGVCIICV